MVDVSRVIEDTEIDVTGRVPIPVLWLICHCILGNLAITRDIHEFLISKKISERIAGEVLLEVDSGRAKRLAAYDWLFYNTRHRCVEGVKPAMGSEGVITFNGGKQTFNATQLMYYDAGDVKHLFKTAVNERDYNEAIYRRFGRNLGVSLLTYTPLMGDITLRHIKKVDPDRSPDWKNSLKGLHDQMLQKNNQ